MSNMKTTKHPIALVGLLFIMFSCEDGPPNWHGIPDARQCSDFVDRMAVCVSGGKEYTCVATDVSCSGRTPKGDIECSPGHLAARALPQRQERHNDDDNTTNMMLMTSSPSFDSEEE